MKHRLSRCELRLVRLSVGLYFFYPPCANESTASSRCTAILQLYNFATHFNKGGSFALLITKYTPILTMLSPLLKTSIFLALPLLASARPQAFQVHSNEGFSIGRLNDWVSAGNYRIYSCASQASHVKDLLDDSYLYLQTAILSTNTAPYKAFFHAADPAPMTTVLGHMTNGTDLPDIVVGSSRPTIVCVNAIDPGIRTAWKLCLEADNRILLQPPGTVYVFLCPPFFNKERTPQSADCGVVSHDRTQLIMQTHTAHSQYGFLVHALADMYIRMTLDKGRAREADVKEVNECLALPPDQAMRNPSSYALYVSSKFLMFISFRTVSVSSFLNRGTENASYKTFEPDAKIFRPRCRFNAIES